MAKAPKTPAAPAATPSTPAATAPSKTPAAAPSQPWAKPGESAGIPTPAAPAVGDAPAPAATAENPPVSGDAPRGDIFDEQGNELQTRDNKSDAPVVAEPEPAPAATAQATADDLYHELGDLTADERSEFETAMTEAARSELYKIKRRRQAREIEVNLVDGNQHFGTRAEQATADSHAAAHATAEDEDNGDD